MKGYVHFNWGVILEKLGQYEEAFHQYDRSVQINPAFFQAWCNRGNMLMEKKEWNQALESFNKALNINPRPRFQNVSHRTTLYASVSLVVRFLSTAIPQDASRACALRSHLPQAGVQLS